MTQSFTETIENNFEAAKSEIETIKSTYTPLSTIQGINQSISTLNSTVNKTITVLETSGTIALSDNSVNSITPSASVSFTLPTVTDNTLFHQILVQVNLTTVVSINVGTTYYFNKTAPDMSEAGVYNLIFEYDKANNYWVCGVLSKGEDS